MAAGRKTGGRQRGTRNKATAEIKAAIRLHRDALVEALLALVRSDDEPPRLLGPPVVVYRCKPGMAGATPTMH